MFDRSCFSDSMSMNYLFRYDQDLSIGIKEV